MITKFKIFEDSEYSENVFWLLNTDKEFLEVALFKLGVPEWKSRHFVNYIEDQIEYKYIYIAPYYASNYISYNAYTIGGYKYYIDKGLKYLGELTLTQEDYNNYDLYKKSKKLNI